jgi:hypothetical protein
MGLDRRPIRAGREMHAAIAQPERRLAALGEGAAGNLRGKLTRIAARLQQCLRIVHGGRG